ncbi:hypothetical protein FRC02_002472 [Tulasnella sp. 418]|nr:hypothetical protein FRC02_002472 [Tulasnella sp. 418]
MVRESVSKPVIGQMRMQFWRDALKSIQQDKPPQHPIAIALHQASKKAHLSPYHLKRIIDARDQDLYAPTHPTLSSLNAYAESTSSTVYYLLLSLLSQNSSSTHSHALSHIGTATTITTLLRALPFHASQRRSIIPTEIASKHGLIEEDLFRYGGSAQGLDEAVYEFATVANDHVITAREMYKDGGIPRAVMPIYLSAVPVTSYLERLEKVNFDAFHPTLQTRDWRLPFRIWRANSKRMF